MSTGSTVTVIVLVGAILAWIFLLRHDWTRGGRANSATVLLVTDFMVTGSKYLFYIILGCLLLLVLGQGNL